MKAWQGSPVDVWSTEGGFVLVLLDLPALLFCSESLHLFRHSISYLRYSVLLRNSTLYQSFRIGLLSVDALICSFYFGSISMDIRNVFCRFWSEFHWSFLNMNWGHESVSGADGHCCMNLGQNPPWRNAKGHYSLGQNPHRIKSSRKKSSKCENCSFTH